MADVAFRIVGAAPLEHSAAPLVCLRTVATSRAPVRAMVLRCLVRIDAAARASTPAEAKELERVLGPADRRVTAPLVWAKLAQNLPAFDGEHRFDLELPCSLDLRTGTSAYLDALEGGEIPITALFSGTVFVAQDAGTLVALPIASTAEASFALPVSVCRAALAEHHGDATLLPVRRDVLARLRRFAAGRATPTLDDAIASLLELAEARR